MKKVVIGLVIVGVLILAGVMVFKRSGGPSQAASLAPAESVVFANVPNIPLTEFRWTRTALARIAAEPEMRTFMKKPLAKFKKSAASVEGEKILSELKPGNIYFAATSQTEEDFCGILGVQFWGKRVDFDNAVAKLRASLPAAAGEPAREEHRGIEIITTNHGDLVLQTAAAGRWGFLSNSSALIKDAIDRATGNSPAPGLVSNPNFLKVITELLSEPDFLVFLQPEKAVDGLLAAGRSIGATAIPELAELLKSTEAAGGAWKIDGEIFRDAFYVLQPGATEPAAPLAYEAMALTTPDTTIFANFVLNFTTLPAWAECLAEGYPDISQTLAPVARLIADGYGPECAIIGTWEKDTMFPSPQLAVKVKAPDSNLVSRIPGASVQTIGTQHVQVIPSPYTSIAAAQNESFLLVGTDPQTVAESLQTHSKTLQDSPLFRDARSAYRNSNEAFCFIDTRTVFERTYGSLLPGIQMSTALLPQLNNQIDSAKLPKPETIGQHLPPIVFSQMHTSDGIRLESSGPLSLSQLLLLAGLTSAAMQ
jgi:hypothetical protein